MFHRVARYGTDSQQTPPLCLSSRRGFTYGLDDLAEARHQYDVRDVRRECWSLSWL